MPAKPIHKYWQDRIKELVANEPNLGPYRMQAMLEVEADANDSLPSPIPVANTIRRWKNAFLRQSKEEQALYLYFRWPQTMEAGMLPWEASRPLLDFLERRGRPSDMGTERPTIRLAKWFWRLYQVALPEEDEWQHNLGPTELDRVESMARQIAALETSIGVTDNALRAVEGWLACHGWTEEGETHYYERVGQGVYPYL